MWRYIAGGFVAAGVMAVLSLTPRAEEAAKDSTALAKALGEAKVSLSQGLRASVRAGEPISGKCELEDGALQLSVYTAKGDQFSEVIVNHKSGAIKKAKIIDAGDLKDATEQSLAMAKAKVSLDRALSSTVKGNRGYRAVSVMPELKDHRRGDYLDERHRCQEGHKKARLTRRDLPQR